MPITRQEILDALTCDSSLEGCDPDWREQVLREATPGEVAAVQRKLELELPKELKTRLGK